MGAWIEIHTTKYHQRSRPVAPLVGAWIEIFTGSVYIIPKIVAPLVGAWIEIDNWTVWYQSSCCRSPRGSVD